MFQAILLAFSYLYVLKLKEVKMERKYLSQGGWGVFEIISHSLVGIVLGTSSRWYEKEDKWIEYVSKSLLGVVLDIDGDFWQFDRNL